MMNDFTKEELEDLYAILYDMRAITSAYIRLEDKIKQMIVNYSDYDSSYFNHKIEVGIIIDCPYEDSDEKSKLGCLNPDGREVSRSEYKELFDILKNTYGEGDGKTTFNLPTFPGHSLKALPNED